MAITYDNSTWQNSGASSSNSFSYTQSGNFLSVFVLFYNTTGNSDKVTSVTYNGVSLTFLSKQTVVNGGGVGTDITMYSFYTASPATGSNTLTASASTSGSNFVVIPESLSGANGGLDASNSSQGTTNGSGNYSTSVTVVASGCWIIQGGFTGGISYPVYSLRAGSGHDSATGDSNGTVSTGVNSPTIHNSGGGAGSLATSFLLSVSPTAASGPANVKTWDGVTQSTGIKTYNGVALASTKTVIGVA